MICVCILDFGQDQIALDIVMILGIPWSMRAAGKACDETIVKSINCADTRKPYSRKSTLRTPSRRMKTAYYDIARPQAANLFAANMQTLAAGAAAKRLAGME